MISCLRIGILAVLACLLLTPSLRAAEHDPDTLATPAAIQHDARQLGEAVRRESNQLARQMARGAHEFKQNVKHWWEQMRSGLDRAGDGARARLRSA